MEPRLKVKLIRALGISSRPCKKVSDQYGGRSKKGTDAVIWQGGCSEQALDRRCIDASASARLYVHSH